MILILFLVVLVRCVDTVPVNDRHKVTSDIGDNVGNEHVDRNVEEKLKGDVKVTATTLEDFDLENYNAKVILDEDYQKIITHRRDHQETELQNDTNSGNSANATESNAWKNMVIRIENKVADGCAEHQECTTTEHKDEIEVKFDNTTLPPWISFEMELPDCGQSESAFRCFTRSLVNVVLRCLIYLLVIVILVCCVMAIPLERKKVGRENEISGDKAKAYDNDSNQNGNSEELLISV